MLTFRPAWKGADPDISILKQAKAEDARAAAEWTELKLR